MDIVIRAVVVFCFLWLVIRVSGKREVAQLSAFDVVLLVTLGDLVTQGILQEDFSLTATILAVSAFALCSYLMSWADLRFRRARPILAGEPRVVVRDGEPLLANLRSERMTLTDLHEAARSQSIRRLSDIELAVLEADGKFSFFTRNDD